jgi:hypothetical protein
LFSLENSVTGNKCNKNKYDYLGAGGILPINPLVGAGGIDPLGGGLPDISSKGVTDPL